MKIVVLGAGVIAVTTAYFLAKDGHEVIVIDRQSESAGECSFANGGQLSYAHMEPWANPAVLPNILKWLGKEDAPLVFRLRADYAMWRWGVQFLKAATHKQSLETTRHMLRLSLYSRELMHALQQECALPFSYEKKGILHVFHDQKALDAEIEQAQFQQGLGVPFVPLAREECMQKEPALRYTEQPLIGGVFFPDDEMGNAYLFTRMLAGLCREQLGVQFHYNTNITRITASHDKVTGVETNKGVFTADSYVLSLGAYSSLYSRQIGISLPIYPMKGYSISIPIVHDEGSPAISLTDQTHKIVYSRLGDIIRVAGTAEFAGYDHSIKERRIAPILNSAQQLFPTMVTDENRAAIQKWACLRPSTPSGIPVLGKSRYPNLFMNTGHGTLGWTLACSSARVVADIIKGKTPDIDMTGLISPIKLKKSY